jgi:hypothetical protein
MAWSRIFEEEVVEAFRDFWRGHRFDAGSRRMSAYVDVWLMEDTERIMKLTGRDYATWLEVVFIVIDACNKDSALLDRRTPDFEETLFERHATDLVINLDFPATFLDRHVYDMLAAGGRFSADS